MILCSRCIARRRQGQVEAGQQYRLDLNKLGIETLLMGKVGNDAFGSMAALLLGRDWGVSDCLVVDEASDTSYTVVINPKGFDRMFIHNVGSVHNRKLIRRMPDRE